LIKNIVAFQLVGYSTWTGEAAPKAFGAYYTKMVCWSKGLGFQAFYLKMPVQIWYRLQTLENKIVCNVAVAAIRFVGVTVTCLIVDQM
jgi:hypothetical protein